MVVVKPHTKIAYVGNLLYSFVREYVWFTIVLYIILMFRKMTLLKSKQTNPYKKGVGSPNRFLLETLHLYTLMPIHSNLKHCVNVLYC